MGLTNDELVAWMRGVGATSAEWREDGALKSITLGPAPVPTIPISQSDEEEIAKRVQAELDKLPFLSA